MDVPAEHVVRTRRSVKINESRIFGGGSEKDTVGEGEGDGHPASERNLKKHGEDSEFQVGIIWVPYEVCGVERLCGIKN